MLRVRNIVFRVQNLRQNEFFKSASATSLGIEKRVYCPNMSVLTHFAKFVVRFYDFFGLILKESQNCPKSMVFRLENLRKKIYFNAVFASSLPVHMRVCCANLSILAPFETFLMRFYDLDHTFGWGTQNFIFLP